MADPPSAGRSHSQPLPSVPGSDQERPGGALPVPLTSFVGREREVVTVVELLQRPDVRLVTLTGPGGVGKTRLALVVAQELAAAFTDGATFVPLAPVRDPSLVVQAITQTLGIRETDELLIDRLKGFLRDKRLLLVLDNFEQVVEAAPLVSDILVACPGLTVLVTSRVRLRVSGEREHAVPPLALPSSARNGDLNRATESEAVRLFVDRARMVQADFALTAENAEAVAGICLRLDGLPLAIELAAVRVKVLPPGALLLRLDQRLQLLTGGPRDQPVRLRTMRGAIAWSHDLLTGPEQVLFRRLAVFVGGFSLAGAEIVAGASGDLGIVPLEGVASLLDQSLLQVEAGPGGEPRYGMLETVREFGLEQLATSGEGGAVRRRHAEFFLALAERSEVAQYLPDGVLLLANLTADYPNLRAALAWLAEQADADALLRLAAALGLFWWLTGSASEGRAWLERAVTLGRTAASPNLAKGLVSLAREAHRQGDEVQALALADEALALTRVMDDPLCRYRALTICGLVTLRLGDLARAATFQTQALAVLTSLGDALWEQLAISSVLGHLGNIAVAQGDANQAEAYFDRALDRQRAQGYAPGTSHVMASHPVAGLGDVARMRGDHRMALDRYREALRLAWQVHDTRAIAYALGGVAGTLAAAGRWEPAARLFGASEALHERVGLPFALETLDRQRALGLPEPWQRADEPFGAGQPLRDALGDRVATVPVVPDAEATAIAWADGRRLDPKDAVAEALDVSFEPTPPAAILGGPEHLTPREVEVLRLLVEGKTDREIAGALCISRRTAATHVARVYGKLGVGSRAAAAAWAVRHGLA